MDDPILLSVIIAVAIILIILPIVIVLSKRADKICINKSKFNTIYVGMPEAELYSAFGVPQQVIEANASTKVVTYRKSGYAFVFLFYVEIEAQVSISNGAVTNAVVSANK